MKNLKYFLNEPVLISLCLGFFCFLVSFVFQFTFIVPQGKEKIKRNFERVLHQKEKTAAGRLEQLRLSALTDSLFHVTKMEEDQQGISFFIYKNNALLYWSTNAIPVPDKTGQQEALFSERVKKLKNGWYEVLYTRDSVWQIVSLILLKHEYSFENEYLDNRFPEDFGIPAGTSLTLGRGDIRIQSYDGNALFSLNLPHKEVKSEFSAFFLFLLYLTGFLFLIAAIYFLYRKLQRRFPGNVLFFIGFIIDVLLLRFFLFYFRIPHIIYNTDLFGPGLFSTSNILPSLGDFLINSLLLLIISYVFFLQFPSASKGKAKSSLIRKILSFWYLLVIAGLAYITIRLARDLIFNSTIPFTLQNISALNGYSVLGLVIIACLFLSFFLVSVRLFSYAAELSRLDQHRGLKRFLFPKFNLAGILVYLVFFSIVGTILLDRTNSMLEKEKRKLIAMKLSGERDPVGELQFASEEDKLLKDPLLQKINSVIPDTSGSLIEDSITDYLENKYFKKGWGSYSIQITFCSNRKILRIQPQNYPMNCARYFQNIINGYGKPTLSRHLYFLDYGYGYRNYLAVIPVGSVPGNEDGSYNAYVEISSFLAYRDVGFPELLIDRKQNPVPDLSQYSYAFYRNGKLQHRVGKYQYSLDLDHAMTHRVKSDHFYSKDGISHYCHPVDDDTIFLLSKKEDTSLDKIAPFSYLFILFSLFSMFFSIIVRFPFFMRISMFRLGDRIQISMIGIMITSFLVIGILVVYYIIGLNSNKNIDNISDRTHSILVELQHKLGMEEELPPDSIQNLDELMMKYSNIFFSDVNLFAPDGRLLATSRPQLFEEGLISGRINRTAFTNLKYNHSSLYIHKETIGKLTYYSAYIPFFNERNSLLAYLNLPYFARQDDLKHEISAFLVAFINIYVFLIIVGIFIVLIVTNYISRPLRMLTSRIRQIAFGEKNQKLEWNRQDEIGRLVDEYNRMIDELEKSAELLARSERESAWREMARQVAHEIKNPLTPMKLSVQYLQKAWDEKGPDWDQRLRRFTEKMTEQIDTLSDIASDFSDFAKIHTVVNEELDLNEIMETAISMYKDIPSVSISFHHAGFPCLIEGDRKQLIRVLTNLLNNSVQAIEEGKRGKIDLFLSKKGNWFLVQIEDNGVGINPEEAGKIFQPNFTTKSSGMGLGLAIVRSIILSHGGEISFSSKPGVSTVFTITLPAGETLIQ